jgi:prolyl-tRNA synthetase
VAEQLYGQLLEKGIEVLYDDRDERPGVKFKDADLVGFPVCLVVGAKSLADGRSRSPCAATARSNSCRWWRRCRG